MKNRNYKKIYKIIHH